jgi:hypothetical protein
MIPKDYCTRTTLSLISFLLLFRLFFRPLPIQLGLQNSVLLRGVHGLPRRKALVRPGDGIPQSNLAIRKDVHRGATARHRDVKLCFVRLAERPNRHADDDLVDRLG